MGVKRGWESYKNQKNRASGVMPKALKASEVLKRKVERLKRKVAIFTDTALFTDEDMLMFARLIMEDQAKQIVCLEKKVAKLESHLNKIKKNRR